MIVSLPKWLLGWLHWRLTSRVSCSNNQQLPSPVSLHSGYFCTNWQLSLLSIQFPMYCSLSPPTIVCFRLPWFTAYSGVKLFHFQWVCPASVISPILKECQCLSWLSLGLWLKKDLFFKPGSCFASTHSLAEFSLISHVQTFIQWSLIYIQNI